MRDLTANQIKNLAKEKMQAAVEEEDSMKDLKETVEFFYEFNGEAFDSLRHMR